MRFVKPFQHLLYFLKGLYVNCYEIYPANPQKLFQRNLNGLQRPATVQFKPDTEHILTNISQWGRIFAEVDDLGTLKTVSSRV